MRKKNKDTTIVEKSGFFIKRQNSDLDAKTLIEPDIKNLNISEMDLCVLENIKIDNNVELGNGDSLRSKISQAVKNRNLKITKDTDIQIDENDFLLEDSQDELGSFKSVNRSRQFVAPKPLVVPVAAPPQPSKAAIKERQPSLDFHEKEIIIVQ